MNDQPKDGMPRAYLRMDPNLDQHPDPLAMLQAMCAAARQPERGRFKERAILDRAVGRRKATAMIGRGDVVTLEDGRLYLDGWDQWQEGDWTVAERMRRMRHRRAEKRNGNGANVSAVTVPASPARSNVTTDAVNRDSQRESLSASGVGDDASPSPAQRGRRNNGTNLRATGSNPRARGTSPRQKKVRDRLAAPEQLGSVMAGTAAYLAARMDQDGTS